MLNILAAAADEWSALADYSVITLDDDTKVVQATQAVVVSTMQLVRVLTPTSKSGHTGTLCSASTNAASCIQEVYIESCGLPQYFKIT